MHRITETVFLQAVFTLILLFQGTYAQPALDFKFILNDWPTIKLVAKAACNGQTITPLHKQNITIKENGVVVPDFTIESCPVPSMNCPMSVGIMFDGTVSTAGQRNTWQKAAGHAFVSTMDGQVENASIMWFSDDYHMVVPMTTDTTALHIGIDALPSVGNADNWYALDSACSWTIQSATNSCKAVIYITDGVCISSSHIGTWGYLSAIHDVRVFTIALGSSTIPTWSDYFSLISSGKAYSAPTPDVLPGIFLDIANRIRDGYEECRITYQSDCPDGGVRTVDLTVSDICGQTLTETRSYRAMKDTSEYEPIGFSLGSASVEAKQQAVLPLTVLAPAPTGTWLYPFRFQVDFDETELTFVEMRTPAGSMLDGASVSTSLITKTDPYGGPDIVTGVEVTVANRVQVTGPGLMAELVFETADFQNATTCRAALKGWIFEAGCLKPQVSGAEVSVYPRSPAMTCSITAPTELEWKQSTHSYSPSTVVVHAEVQNTGTGAAEDVQFTIQFDSGDFLLDPTQTVTLPGSPVNVDPGGKSSVVWNLLPNVRLTGDSVTVTVTTTFDNHAPVVCTHRLWIPPVGPVLECSIEPVSIVADQDLQRYSPMPFPVSVIVRNTGGAQTEPIYATITLPQGLEFGGADAPGSETKSLVPIILAHAQEGTVQWTLTHPPVQQEKQYTVVVVVKTANADSSTCEVEVVIPKLEAPNLSVECTVPDSLRVNPDVDEGNPSQGLYLPNPFDVTITAVNLGSLTADNVTAMLYLPDGVSLDPPSQTLRKTFGNLAAWSVGDPIPTLTWSVRYTKSYRYDTNLQFRWVVGGVSSLDQKPLDSLISECSVIVEGLPQSLSCWLQAPAFLPTDSSGTDVTPNPFTMKYFIQNTGKRPATVASVEAMLPLNDMELDRSVPGNDQVRLVQTTLEPDFSISVEWKVKVQRSLNERDLTLRAVALDDENNPIECTADIHVAAISTALTCDLALDTQTLEWDAAAQKYKDSLVTATLTIANAGGFPQSSVQTEMTQILDPLGLVELDPGYQNENPVAFPVLFPGQSKEAHWHFRLVKPNTTGAPYVVTIHSAYGSVEVPRIENLCSAQLVIEPVTDGGASFACSIAMPDTLHLDAAGTGVEPNPFDVMATVENTGSGDVMVRKVVVYFPNDGLSLSPSVPSNTQTRVVDIDLAPGNNTSFSWTFDVSSRCEPRTIPIRIEVFDAEDVLSVCEKTLFIIPLETSLTCSLALQPDVLEYDIPLQTYEDSLIAVTATFTNTGMCEIAGVTAELKVNNQTGMYVELDPNAADNSNPKTTGVIPVGQSALLTWQCRLANDNTTGVVQMVELCADYSSPIISYVEGSCCALVQIEPVKTTAVDNTPEPMAYALGVNYPNPFSAFTDISYTVAHESHVSIVVYSVLGREVATLVHDSRGAGRHTVRFNAQDLPGGVYILKMNAQGYTATRIMQLQR